MKNKKIVFYSVYKETTNNDLQLITQFDTLQQIADTLNIKKNILKSQISRKQKIKNNYIIFKDVILSNEL